MIAVSLFFSFFNFLLLAGVLWFFLRKPVHELFSGRRETIAVSLAASEKRLRTAREQHFIARHRLQHLDEEIAKMVALVRRAGDEERALLKERAHAVAARIEEETKRHVERELLQASRDVRKLALAKAFDEALEMIKNSTTPADQSHFALLVLQELQSLRGFGKELSASAPSTEVCA